MKNRKAFYFNLIILIVAFLSMGLTMFRINTITVKADSGNFEYYSDDLEDSNYVSLNNSIYIDNNSILNDSIEKYADNKTTVTLIFKLDRPIKGNHISYVFEIEHKINLLNVSNQYRFYGENFDYNETNTLTLSWNKHSYPNPLKGISVKVDNFQYIQLDIPLIEVNTEFEFLNLSLYPARYPQQRLTAELVYVVDGINQKASVNLAKLAPVVSNLDVLRDGFLKYNNFIINSKRKAFNMPFVFNPENEEIILRNESQSYYGKTLPEICNSIIEECGYEGTNIIDEERDFNHPTNISEFTHRKFKFVGWDNQLNDLTDYSKDIVINAIYEEMLKVEYNISFYGKNNELIYTNKLTRFADGTIDEGNNLLTLGNIYYYANEAASNFYYNYEFIEWDIPYVDETITSDLNVSGIFKKIENKECTIKVYDESKTQIIATIFAFIGQKLSELNLPYEEKIGYELECWLFVDKPNMGVELDYIIEENLLMLAPLYKQTDFKVIIITRAVYEQDKPVTWNKNFKQEALFEDICKVGDHIQLPKPKYIKNFTPVAFYEASNFITIDNYLLIESIADIYSDTFTIPNINEDLIITLIYKLNPDFIIENDFEDNKPTTPEQPGTDIDNENKTDGEKSKITLITWLNQNWFYVVIIAVVALIVFVISIILIIRRRKFYE